MGRLPPLHLLLLSLSSCARYADLEPTEVAGLAIRVGDGRGTVCVNDNRARVVAEVLYPDGKRVATWDGEGSRHGKLRLHDLAIASDPVGVDGLGRIAFPADPTRWLDRRLTFGARVPDRTITARITVTPRFDCGGLADHRGAPGLPGSAGEDGKRGADGPTLRVALAWIDTELHGRLVLARVTRPGDHPLYYLADPRAGGARFTIAAAGGTGGAGASGLSGSNGLEGTDGTSGGTCQNGTGGGPGYSGGRGGDGGDGGDGGTGGTILVETAPADADLVHLIGYDVRGGAAGAAGRGGDGGDGGEGGSGGAAGSNEDSDGDRCSTTSGTDGMDGTDGTDGAAGRSGRAGRDGQLTVRATLDPSTAWAEEIAAGMRIVVEPSVVARPR